MPNGNLSNSALRVFEIYKKLLCTDIEQKELLQNFSDDTLQIYINTLKKLGIRINSPKKGYNKYHLKDNFNFLHLDNKDIKILSVLKNIFAQNDNYSDIVDYNNFLLKLIPFLSEEYKQKIQQIVNAEPFGKNLHPLIFDLKKFADEHRTLLIKYNSPSGNIKTFRITPVYFALEKSKLYLWGEDKELNDIRCLKVDRISEIMPLKPASLNQTNNNFVICEADNNLMKINNINVEILETYENKIKIKFFFKNEFDFLQKMLSFGSECKIIAPEQMKIILKNKLKSMEKIYE